MFIDPGARRGRAQRATSLTASELTDTTAAPEKAIVGVGVVER
jgi:hypothetical protein